LPRIARPYWLALALVAAFALVANAATTAAAHAVLLRGTPSDRQTLERAPDRVQLLFSEPLDQVFSSLRVLDARGQRVDTGDGRVEPTNDHLLVVSLQPGLPNGVYTVFWRSLSAIDVHPDEGQYQLFVGVPVASTTTTAATITATPETTFGRWWFSLAASLFGGLLATWKLVLSPVLTGQNAAPRAAVRRTAYRLIVLGGVLLIVGTLYTAVAQAAAAANVTLVEAVGKPITDLLLRGRFAAIWWPRMGLEVASLLLIVLGGIEGLAAECALATLPAVLLTSAITSHGAALPVGTVPGIAVDWFHILGATAWVGGLIGVLISLPAMRHAGRSNLDEALRCLVARFGRYALIASALVAVSGALQGALEVGSLAALLSTTYGELVLVKIGLLLAMLLLATFNEWRARAADSVAVGEVRGLRRGVRVELAVGVVVLGVAAMLSGTPPSPLGT
jgi:copper transport protein